MRGDTTATTLHFHKHLEVVDYEFGVMLTPRLCERQLATLPVPASRRDENARTSWHQRRNESCRLSCWFLCLLRTVEQPRDWPDVAFRCRPMKPSWRAKPRTAHEDQSSHALPSCHALSAAIAPLTHPTLPFVRESASADSAAEYDVVRPVKQSQAAARPCEAKTACRSDQVDLQDVRLPQS